MIASFDSWSSLPFQLSSCNSQVPTLGSQEVHVWCASLDRWASYLPSFQQNLTSDEQHKAERFYFPKDRKHYIIARGLLRRILSRYLDKKPSHLRFCYGPYGKPALLPEQGGDVPRFNVSHSRGLALYAVTWNWELGVDLEFLRTDFPCQEIAERFFSPKENAVLRTLPAHLQHRAFFSCWTRKEAYVKATGKGLSISLDQFDVSLMPDESAALLRTQWDAQEACRWSLQELIPAPSYVAALAVEGDRRQLQCWQFAPPRLQETSSKKLPE